MAFDRRWLFGIVGLAATAVALTGVGLYWAMSSRVEPKLAASPSLPGAMEPATPANTVPKAAIPSIEVAADRLAQRLKASDGTGDDWALLARSYAQMRRYPEAVDAFGKALEKMPGNKAFLDEQAVARKAAGGDAPSK